MTTHRSDSPAATLTRHFFSSFFRLSFLDDAGEESFKRAIFGLLVAILAIGMFLGRLYMVKYGRLAALSDVDLVRAMVLGDALLMIALPMMTVGFVIAPVSHSVFPDETDFRTLMWLPLTRRTIFAAKIAAVALFASIFVGGATVAFVLPLSLLTGTRLAHGAPLQTMAAGLTAGLLAAVFTVGVVVALQGIVIVVLPREWLRRASVLLQTTVVGGLVLLLPAVAHAPGQWPLLRAEPLTLFAIPPVWFLGIQQVLLGVADQTFSRLALVGVAASAVVVLVVVSCYAVVYKRFDQTVLRPPMQAKPGTMSRRSRSWIRNRHPVEQAVRTFTLATLARSGLHQLVCVSVFAAGVALAANRVAGSLHSAERWLMIAALGAPLLLTAGAVVGLRIALRLPTNLRAGWIFRITEDRETRPRQLDAVRRVVLLLAGVPTVLLAWPLYSTFTGWRTASALMPILVVIVWCLVEIVCVGWRRIPFTCTFLFARRPPAYTVGALVLIFGWFVFIGAAMLNSARASMTSWLAVMIVLATIGLSARWYRRQTWGHYPLEFEDYMPDGLDTLRLGS